MHCIKSVLVTLLRNLIYVGIPALSILRQVTSTEEVCLKVSLRLSFLCGLFLFCDVGDVISYTIDNIR